MALTTKQRNIVNPNPGKYAGDGRNGTDYIYDEPRNQWVISGIHDTYINFGTFSSIGQKLLVLGPLTEETRTITVEDALAYAALYPQNAIVKKARTVPPIREINPDQLTLMLVGDEAALVILREIADDTEGIDNLLSVTTQLSQLIENQSTIDQPAAGQSVSTKVAQMPDVENTIPQEKVKQIRTSFGNATPAEPSSDFTHIVVRGDTLSGIAVIYNMPLNKIVEANPQIRNIDLIYPGDPVLIPGYLETVSPSVTPPPEPIEDQGAAPQNVKTGHNPFVHAPPEDPNPEPYYNTSDQYWYYVKRTNAVNPRSYDIGLVEGSAPVRENFRKLKERGLNQILKAAGKEPFATAEQKARLLSGEDLTEGVEVGSYYGDPGRPHSGTGKAPTGEAPRPVPKRWIVYAKVSKTTLDSVIPSGAIPPTGISEGDMTSLQLLKAILSTTNRWTGTMKNAPFKLEDLKQNLKETARVLREYDAEVTSEGMTPELMSGLSLEAQAEHVDTFYATVEQFLALNKITTTSDSTIEFMMDASYVIQLIVVDGTAYTKGYGRSFTDDPAPSERQTADGNPTSPSPTQTSATNLFAGITPTTLGYMFYCKEISAIGKTSANKIPWTEFVTKFTWPNPIIYPAAVQRKKEEDKKKGKLTKEEEEQIFKTAGLARKQTQQRLAISSKDMINTIRASAGQCGSAQAALLRDAMQVYQLFTGKMKRRDIIALVASKIRDQLLEEHIKKYKLTDLEFYTSHPDKVLRLVEEEVNNQLFCIIEVIGDLIDTQILKPGGIPPGVRTLVSEALVPPKGIKFSQQPTTDFMALWRKKIEQLVFSFIKQMILSVLGDVVKAALGCGPESSDAEDNPDKLKGSAIDTYGNIQINVLVDGAGDIDLVRVATDSGLVNRYSRRNDQDQKIVVEEAATIDQLRQFNRDTSNILLMTETTALLQSNAKNRTIGIINEMVNKGFADLSDLSPDEKGDPLLVAERQESLKRDDTKYASLGITPEKIIQYFATIGSLLSGVEGLLPKVDPKEAFCEAKDPPVPSPVITGLSEAQLLAEIDSQITAKLEEVKSLCELAKFNFSFQLEIDNFMENLPFAGFYNAFLQYLADLSNAARKAIEEALFAQVANPAPEQAATPLTQTQLYLAASNFYESKKSRVFLSIANPDGDYADDGDQREKTTPDIIWFTGDKDLGEMFFRFHLDNKVSVAMNRFPAGENTPGDQVIRDDMFTFKLAEDNTPNLPRTITVNDQVVNNPDKANYSIVAHQPYRTYPNPDHGWQPSAPSRLVEPANPDDFINTGPLSNPMRMIQLPVGVGTSTQTNNYSPDLVAAANTDIRRAALLGESPNLSELDEDTRRTYHFSNLFDNRMEEFRTQLLNFWLTAQGKTKLQNLTKVLSQPAVRSLNNDCLKTKEENIAVALINTLQVRVANFMLNAGPLLRVYNGWAIPDTVNMMVGYLAYKIEKDLRERKIFDLVLSSLDNVEKVMVDDEEGGQLSEYNQIDDLQDKFVYLIRQILLTLFKNMSENDAYASVTNNFFEKTPQQSVWKRWYNTYSDYVYNGRFLVAGFDHAIENQVTGFHASGPAPGWNSAADKDAFRKISFLRYFPVPLIRGLQIIYYDKAVDFLHNYAPFNFFAGQRAALADDGLLGAINEQKVTVYSNPYMNFPVEIDGETFYGYRDIRNRINELDEAYEDIVKQELMFGSHTTVPVFEARALGGGSTQQRITPPLLPPNPETSDNINRIRILTTPYGVLGTPEENYVSRAYPRTTNSFLRLRAMPGVSHTRLINQGESGRPQLTLGNKFGLADPTKGEGRRLQKLSYSDVGGSVWKNTFEGSEHEGGSGGIYEVAWDAWAVLSQNIKNSIIREALTTPYVSALGVIEAAMTSPGDYHSNREDLTGGARFKPWASVERQRLLYGVNYDIPWTAFSYNFLEAFSAYSTWPESNGIPGRSDDYEQLHVTDADSPLWEAYSANGVAALFDVEWSTEWWFNFATPQMADGMIAWYNSDSSESQPLKARDAHQGAVLDKVGINHLYLKLAAASADLKPVVDRANLNSKINKLQAFYDNRG